MLRKNLLFTCVVLCLMATACSGANAPQTVKVAVTMPLGIEVGEDMLNAVKLALDEAQGQAGEVAVELLVFDSSDSEGSPVSPEAERDAATQAVADQTVVAYLGAATTDQAKASMSRLNEASITQISPSATWPGLTKPGYGPGEPGIYYPTGRRHFFRVVPSDEIQGMAAARWASQLGVQTVYIVEDGTDYGHGISGLFDVTAQDLGIDIIGHADLKELATPEEHTALAASIIEAQPDLVYFGGGFMPQGGSFISAVRGLDRDVQIMGPDGLVQDQLITDLGVDLVAGIYATNMAISAEHLESEITSDFLLSYRATYAKEPPSYAVSSYEAMKVLLYAISRAETPTREGILEAMKALGEFSGIFGAWRFDAQGDISATAISGMQIQTGQWSFVQIVE